MEMNHNPDFDNCEIIHKCNKYHPCFNIWNYIVLYNFINECVLSNQSVICILTAFVT